MKKKALILGAGIILLVFFSADAGAAGKGDPSKPLPMPAFAKGRQPITVNGDTVEFLSEGREVSAKGNVEVVYQDSVMRCESVRVFIDEKLAIAEGNVFLTQKNGQELRGEMIIYDFGEKTGTIISPQISFWPYFVKADMMDKLSDEEFQMNQTELSTCDLPHPHYKLTCREVDMKPGRVMQAHGIGMCLGDTPLMYIPYMSQQMTDSRPRLMILPGHRSGFGTELFGSYRYYLNESTRGLLHLDWYQKKGLAEGVDLNYHSKWFGMGNDKYYRIDEKDDDSDNTRERFRAEIRHQWDITSRDHAMLEFFKSSDFNFRHDYFNREFERDPQPPSYFSFTHQFPDASFSLLAQPRVNDFETVLQKLPEARLDTRQLKIGDTSLYYKNSTSVDYLSQTTANGGVIAEVGRADTTNKLNAPFRFGILNLDPFVGHRETVYSRGITDDEDLFRSTYFTGLDASTKFFRTFDVDSNILGMNIHKLRHILTPSIQYLYQGQPSVTKNKLFQLDAVDALDLQNTMIYGLQNKLQTKRNGQSVDLAMLLVKTDYNFQRNTTAGRGFQTVVHDLELYPYSWLTLSSRGTYDLVAAHERDVSVDAWSHWARIDTGIGYYHKYKESSQFTTSLSCALNPFWRASLYERFEFNTGTLVEQEYRLTRDMHCWLMELIVNKRDAEGLEVMVGFKLKAFPGISVDARGTLMQPPRQ